ncbi:hypothetical protein [Halarcobacter anaerophilus]|uniref:Uncharacterized protein n=1 Tax=Halarcobacter anaerophilus TaxID=877500 RepID=A0A4Q0Y5H2_9BACT|nr:hypothetical protein [Halarcobacter anaerophilus]QDF28966.1 hypothetical protein AANAER_1486 [Halarcobacter anaerophilus]RXJ63601.1 hypothetical protein CRV06_05255 [Halarcobacter anaerophilus]
MINITTRSTSDGIRLEIRDEKNSLGFSQEFSPKDLQDINKVSRGLYHFSRYIDNFIDKNKISEATKQ